eukprot:CAMPEP_0169442004 /NCGR_PEP_ID=MMETSP1042-20121227/8599_1 /TAXON_ID=464988 /ORGANISM="Hemiselmis andersenii, Strain CCMP1180" /LENGTH=405 /DNA_ID=CAMNT_0009553153 /DNA_START=54 /DNA_END=1271 /DNA_ORIENTATION=+
MKLFNKMLKSQTLDDIKIDQAFSADTEQRRKELQGFTIADMETRNTLGTGSFGRVRLCKHKPTGKIYAVKMLSKALVLRTKQLDHIMAEKEILETITHPFIINMYGVSQDETYLYLALEYSIGGELFTHLRRATRFSNDAAMHYSGQVVLIFEYLHSMHIVYRDLKPENLLLDSKGQLKMCDFGFAKTCEPGTNTWTLCGTPEYLAPEIILNKGHGKPVDWWTLGILTYEMLAGYPPFYADDRMQLYQKILGCELEWPKHFKSRARDLICQLLTPDLSRRLGNFKDGGRDVRKHSWFSKLDFQALALGQLKAPIDIKAASLEDTSNFDHYSDNEGPDVKAGKVKDEQQALFENFDRPLGAGTPNRAKSPPGASSKKGPDAFPDAKPAPSSKPPPAKPTQRRSSGI